MKPFRFLALSLKIVFFFVFSNGSWSCQVAQPATSKTTAVSQSRRAYLTFLAGDSDYVKVVVGLAKGLRKEHRRVLVAQGCIVRQIEPVYPPENGTKFAWDLLQALHLGAHHQNISAAVELLKQGIAELNVEPYDEDQGTGELRYVQMAVTTYNTSLPYAERYRNGKVQVALVWNSRDENSPSSKKLNALANFLWRYGGPNRKVHLIHSVWANFQTSINNVTCMGTLLFVL